MIREINSHYNLSIILLNDYLIIPRSRCSYCSDGLIIKNSDKMGIFFKGDKELSIKDIESIGLIDSTYAGRGWRSFYYFIKYKENLI